MNAIYRPIGRARRSIAVRLSMLLLAVFVLISAGMALHFSAVLGREFDAGTAVELQAKIEVAQRVLDELPAVGELSSHGQHFDDILRGYHHLLLVILASDGTVLYRSAGFDAVFSPLLDSIRAQVAADREGDLLPLNDSTFVARTARGWFAGANAPVWIAVAADVRDHSDVLRSHTTTMVVALLLGAAITTLGGAWMMRRALGPVRRLAAAEARISAGRLDERIDADDVPSELSGLVEGYNAMLDRLQDSFRRLSDFSSDLAHELRVPINSLVGHAQVALTRPRTVSEYAATLEAIAEDGERIAGIVREMLFLAQADNSVAVLDKKPVELRAELDKVAAYFAILGNDRGISIACEGRAQVMGDRLMLQRAISNLLSNALSHTPDGGAICACVETDAHGTVSLEVRNPGPGIPADQLPRVFDRFFRVQGSSSAQGTGLGLAIVKSIMALHGGSAMAASTPKVETLFRLEFPRDPRLTLTR